MKYLLLLPIAILVIVFAASNPAPVTFSLFPIPYEISAPPFLLLLGVFALGAICGGMIVSLKNLRLRHSLKQSRRRASALEHELASRNADTGGALMPLPKL